MLASFDLTGQGPNTRECFLIDWLNPREVSIDYKANSLETKHISFNFCSSWPFDTEIPIRSGPTGELFLGKLSF